MARYVVLLRAVNLGSTNKVAMADLRELFESLGYGDVRTFIQSGNVVFSSTATVKAPPIEAALADRFGFSIPVMLRSQRQLAAVVKGNPFADVDPARIHVGFLARPPGAKARAGLDKSECAPDQFRIRGSDAYLHLAGGVANNKVTGYLTRKLGIPMTVRTWQTVTKLLDLANS